LFFNSLFTKSQFYYYFGSSRAQEIVTPLGVEDWWCERRAPKFKKGDLTPYFICVGNVRPHKNLNILFQAFSAIVNLIPHQLVVVGEHEGFRTSVANFADLLDAFGERVRFLGRISDADLFEYISNADALIFPSLYEGFGLPALEAMAAGCPVIVSTAGALPEVCGEFAAAYFDPMSIEQLSIAMIEHAKLSQQARLNLIKLGQDYSKIYNWDKTAALTAGAMLHISKTLSAS
jgi:glycosyltransferase involved in cell wall biosynthesis